MLVQSYYSFSAFVIVHVRLVLQWRLLHTLIQQHWKMRKEVLSFAECMENLFSEEPLKWLLPLSANTLT
jgi:hypothetical protein